MPTQQPTIDLAGYRRLSDLERHIWYSPLSVAVYLICLAAVAFELWNLRRGLVAIPRSILVGHALFVASYAVLWAYFYGYRFRQLKCPGCDQLMQPFVADLEDGTWRRFMWAFAIGGRFYRRAYQKHGRGPWIHLMRTVCACPRCRTFVDCSRLHQQPCTLEELTQLYRHHPAA